jgi:hypothetical protein
MGWFSGKDDKPPAEDKRENAARRTYLRELREARMSGADDWEAAKIAEKATKAKHGKLPKENPRGWW